MRPDFVSSPDFLPINLGGNPFGWTADQDASYAVLDRFVELGGSFIDTADGYSAWVEGNAGGESEEIIGRWMTERGNREQVQIATKVATKPDRKGLSRDTVLAAIDESLQRLGTDYVDLYYAHFDDEDVAIEDQVHTFHDVVQAGKARAIGVSNFAPDRMRRWFELAEQEGLTVPVAIQPRYTLVSREGYERDVAPIVADHSPAVFCYPALASGFLTGKYRTEADFEGAARGSAAKRYADAGGLRVVDALVAVGERHDAAPATVALAWLLAKGVTAPIASASRPDQLDAVMAAPSLQLGADDVAELDAASEGF